MFQPDLLQSNSLVGDLVSCLVDHSVGALSNLGDALIPLNFLVCLVHIIVGVYKNNDNVYCRAIITP